MRTKNQPKTLSPSDIAIGSQTRCNHSQQHNGMANVIAAGIVNNRRQPQGHKGDDDQHTLSSKSGHVRHCTMNLRELQNDPAVFRAELLIDGDSGNHLVQTISSSTTATSVVAISRVRRLNRERSQGIVAKATLTVTTNQSGMITSVRVASVDDSNANPRRVVVSGVTDELLTFVERYAKWPGMFSASVNRSRPPRDEIRPPRVPGRFS